MDRYSLIWCNRYMDELLDKMGSDLFPLPIKLNRFQTICLDFIRETTEYLEASQEISDDIRPLMKREEFSLTQKSDKTLSLDYPPDYLRLIGAYPITSEGDKVSKKVSILKEGQWEAYKRDPYREPTEEYPAIFRHGKELLIDVGNAKRSYDKAIVSYISKPIFASVDDLNQRIVNLPDISIEKIMLKTCDSLRITTADETGKDSFAFSQTFGKKNS